MISQVMIVSFVRSRDVVPKFALSLRYANYVILSRAIFSDYFVVTKNSGIV